MLRRALQAWQADVDAIFDEVVPAGDFVVVEQGLIVGDRFRDGDTPAHLPALGKCLRIHRRVRFTDEAFQRIAPARRLGAMKEAAQCRFLPVIGAR